MFQVLINSMLLGAFIGATVKIQARVRAVQFAQRNPTRESLAAVRDVAGRNPAWLVAAQVAGGGAFAGLIDYGLQEAFHLLPNNPYIFPLDLLIGWVLGILIAMVIQRAERKLPGMSAS